MKERNDRRNSNRRSRGRTGARLAVVSAAVITDIFAGAGCSHPAVSLPEISVVPQASQLPPVTAQTIDDYKVADLAVHNAMTLTTNGEDSLSDVYAMLKMVKNPKILYFAAAAAEDIEAAEKFYGLGDDGSKDPATVAPIINTLSVVPVRKAAQVALADFSVAHTIRESPSFNTDSGTDQEFTTFENKGLEAGEKIFDSGVNATEVLDQKVNTSLLKRKVKQNLVLVA